MPIPTFDQFRLHQLSRSNRNAAQQSALCGCFYCRRIFAPSQINNWCTEPGETRPATALCPHCGVDAVLASAHADLTPELLDDMHRAWFTRDSDKP